MNSFFNRYSGFRLPASKTVVAKLEIIQGSLVGAYSVHFRGLWPIQGPQEGSDEWIIILNILDSIEWIFLWMNIPDFVLNWILNWIIFRPNSMKKWIFKTYRTGLVEPQYMFQGRLCLRWEFPFLLVLDQINIHIALQGPCIMVDDDLAHNCTIFLCSLDVANIDDHCRIPSIKEKYHLAG